MNVLLKVSAAIDWVNLRIGKWCTWLILITVVISAANAVMRKVFDLSSNAWLEMQWYLFSAVFLFCASWTLLVNEHIRIDIVNSFFPKRVRDWIDVLGHTLFLLPLTIVMIVTSWPFFLASWQINEQSGNAGGLAQWPAKLMIPVGFTLLFFQAISELIKRLAVIADKIADPYGEASLHHPAELEVERFLEAAEKKP